MIDLRHAFRSLDRDEGGAVLTEFAATLPVFLLFFGALIGLGNLTQAAIQAHADAGPKLWSDVFAAEDEEDIFLEAGTPVKEREESTGNYVDRSTDISDIARDVDEITETDRGHWGESQQMLDRLNSELNDGDLMTSPFGTSMSVRSDPRQQDMLGEDGTNDFGSWSGWAVADDRMGQTQPPMGSTLFGDARNNIPYETNAGWAAGTRYSAVAAENELEVDPGYGIPNAEYKVSYSSRISPTAALDMSIGVSGIESDWLDHPETRAWLAARMWADDHNEYGQLFDLGDTSRLDHDKMTAIDIYTD